MGRYGRAWSSFLVALLFAFASTVRGQTTSSLMALAQYLTCAVRSDGVVMCWGVGGSLGDGTTTSSNVPVVTYGITAGTVTSLDAGNGHTLALLNDGSVKCWGANDLGQCGDGTTTIVLTPITVSGLTGTVTSMASAHNGGCAAMQAGGILCWGYNSHGQVGDGATGVNRLTPVAVSGITGTVTKVYGGWWPGTFCAVLESSIVKCWGRNDFGQCGDGTTTDRNTPVTMTAITETFETLAMGMSHVCALLESGAVKCWGKGSEGQLGDGTSFSYTGVAVSGITTATSLDAGEHFSCASLEDGSVKCWGQNTYGQLGDGTNTQRNTPVTVSGISTAVNVACGVRHVCAALQDGGMTCWGYGGQGQLGNGVSGASSSTPVVVGSPALALFQVMTYTSSGVIITVSANSSVTRPDYSLLGRVWVDGPSGNVGIGDLTLYNSAAAPSSRLEIDGNEQIRGNLIFNNVNGVNQITVNDASAAALSLTDRAATPTTYFTINSISKVIELHAPLQFVGDQGLVATPNMAQGLQFTDGAGNSMLVFDTQTGAENLIAHVPVNAIDTTDACDTSADSTCALKAAVVTSGGLVVGKKTFMTGTLRVADLTDAYTDGNGDVDASVRLAGGLAVEKSVHVKQKLHVLSDEDGTGAGAGAFVVTGGASVNGYVFLGKDAGHSVTVDTDFATTANAVSIAATANNDAGITLASSGTNGLISLTAAETVTITGQSATSAGSGGVTLVGGGAANAGYIKLQQEDSSDSGTPRDRVVVASDGSVTISTKSGSDLVMNSEGSAPRVVSLNQRRTEVSKVVAITDDKDTTPVLAVVNLQANSVASVFITVSCVLGGAPATLHAELRIGHHSGAAPEPNASSTPPRTGLVRATYTKGAAASGALELIVTPDDSNGAAATKDFVISVYAAVESASSNVAAETFTPTDTTAVIRAEGTFESLQ